MIVLMGELQEQMANVNDPVNKWKDNRFCIQSEAFLSMTTSKSAAQTTIENMQKRPERRSGDEYVT